MQVKTTKPETQAKNIRVLEIYEGVMVDLGDRYHVVLVAPDGEKREAFIKKVKIKRCYKRLECHHLGYGSKVCITRYFIEYDSNHPFYSQFWKELPPDVEEASLKDFIINPHWLKRVGKRYRIYLNELERWDSYLLRLSDAISAYYTNIHPIYGVMD